MSSIDNMEQEEDAIKQSCPANGSHGASAPHVLPEFLNSEKCRNNRQGIKD